MMRCERWRLVVITGTARPFGSFPIEPRLMARGTTEEEPNEKAPYDEYGRAAGRIGGGVGTTDARRRRATRRGRAKAAKTGAARRNDQRPEGAIARQREQS